MADFFKGQILIASPNMDDERFKHSIILICDHDEDHAIGIVLNKKIPDLSLHKLMNLIGLKSNDLTPEFPILNGGPCDTQRGFVIHSDDFIDADTIEIAAGVNLSNSIDILKRLTTGARPKNIIVALGHSGWGPGQLEEELLQNIWFITAPSHNLIFSENENKWKTALELIGLNPSLYNGTIGHA